LDARMAASASSFSAVSMALSSDVGILGIDGEPRIGSARDEGVEPRLRGTMRLDPQAEFQWRTESVSFARTVNPPSSRSYCK
jgi:hypothetical protein